MKLTLDIPIEVEVTKNGIIKEKLKVTFRYPTKQEEKEFENLEKEIKTSFKRISKIQREIEKLNKKIEYAEKLGNYEKAEKLLEKVEKLEAELDKLAEDFEAKGGENYPEEMAKKTFEMLVGGKDKEKLREYAEAVGYVKIIDLLRKERDKIEKKQQLTLLDV